MDNTAPSAPTLLLVDASVARVQALSTRIQTLGKYHLLPSCRTCSDAIGKTKTSQPSLVFMSADLAGHESFHKYCELLKSLSIEWYWVVSNGGHSAPSLVSSKALDPVRHPSEKLSVDEILKRKFGRRPNPGVPAHMAAEMTSNVVVIGASTGGVEALTTILTELPSECPPILIVQHMGTGFMKSFVKRMNSLCAPDVVEAQDRMSILPGRVIVAPDQAKHLTICRHSFSCRLEPGDRVSGHIPSVDVLFRSAIRLAPRLLAIILTGMGKDGADGLLQIRRAGGSTIAQDQDSSVVYGMPRVAYEIGAVQRRLPVERIGAAIQDSYLANLGGSTT